MGYLFVLIALLCGVVKGFCGKKSSGTLVHTSDAMLVNTVRMLACIFVGFAMIALGGELGSLRVSSEFLLISAVSGIATAAFVVTWLLSVKQGAYMMVDVFLLIGVILPLLLCRIIYGEEILPVQWLGIALLIVAGYVICTYNVSIKGKMSPLALVVLVFCTISSGTADLMQKMFIHEIVGGSITVFNFYTYIFAAAILALCFFLFRRGEKKKYRLAPPAKIIMPVIVYVGIMAVCLFMNSYFKTAAAAYLDAVQIYPLSQGGAVILSMAMSAICFGEKINLRCIAGVVLSFVALVLINLIPAYMS